MRFYDIRRWFELESDAWEIQTRGHVPSLFGMVLELLNGTIRENILLTADATLMHNSGRGAMAAMLTILCAIAVCFDWN